MEGDRKIFVLKKMTGKKFLVVVVFLLLIAVRSNLPLNATDRNSPVYLWGSSLCVVTETNNCSINRLVQLLSSELSHH